MSQFSPGHHGPRSAFHLLSRLERKHPISGVRQLSASDRAFPLVARPSAEVDRKPPPMKELVWLAASAGEQEPHP